jgi:predicted PurR-regulated permease PerM
MRRLAISTILILLTLVGLILFWEFRLAVILFLSSLVVAGTVRPATDWWVRRGLSRGLAIILTYLIGLVILGGMLYLIGGSLMSELQDATNRFAIAYRSITSSWPEGTTFQQAVASRLPPLEDLYEAATGEQGVLLLQNMLGVAQSVFLVVGQFLIVLVLSIYWTVDQVRFERIFLTMLPAHQRSNARTIWRAIETGVGGYLRSEIIQSLLAFILLVIGYQLMQVPYPVFLALVGSLLWLIPWLGAILALILPFLSGWLVSPALALVAAAFTFTVLLVLQVVVEPRLFNRNRYDPLLIVVMIVALADAFGLVGILIAPPLAAAIHILFDHFVRRSTPTELTSPHIQVARLRARLEQVHERIESGEEELTPEAASLIERLEELIEEAQDALGDNGGEIRPNLGLPASSETAVGT